MAISYFFVAAAGGFVLLAAVGIQGLVALFSSISLTRRHQAEYPGFNTTKAYRRIAQVTVLVSILVLVVTALVLRFSPIAVTIGYMFGMILAFLCCLKRMSPNNEINQKNYEEAYADCYPASGENPDDHLESTKRLPVVPKSAAPDTVRQPQDADTPVRGQVSSRD